MFGSIRIAFGKHQDKQGKSSEKTANRNFLKIDIRSKYEKLATPRVLEQPYGTTFKETRSDRYIRLSEESPYCENEVLCAGDTTNGVGTVLTDYAFKWTKLAREQF